MNASALRWWRCPLCLRQKCGFLTTSSAERLEEVELKQLMHHPAERLSSQVSSLVQIPIQSFSSPGQLFACYAILKPYGDPSHDAIYLYTLHQNMPKTSTSCHQSWTSSLLAAPPLPAAPLTLNTQRQMPPRKKGLKPREKSRYAKCIKMSKR